MEPELEHQRAFVDEHGLEAVDLVEQFLHLGALHLLLDAVGDRLQYQEPAKMPILPLGGSARQ